MIHSICFTIKLPHSAIYCDKGYVCTHWNGVCGFPYQGPSGAGPYETTKNAPLCVRCFFTQVMQWSYIADKSMPCNLKSQVITRAGAKIKML